MKDTLLIALFIALFILILGNFVVLPTYKLMNQTSDVVRSVKR